MDLTARSHQTVLYGTLICQISRLVSGSFATPICKVVVSPTTHVREVILLCHRKRRFLAAQLSPSPLLAIQAIICVDIMVRRSIVLVKRLSAPVYNDPHNNEAFVSQAFYSRWAEYAFSCTRPLTPLSQKIISYITNSPCCLLEKKTGIRSFSGQSIFLFTCSF